MDVTQPFDTERELVHDQSRFSLRNRMLRLLWLFTWTVLFRLTPRPFCSWRNMLLRLFGAKLGRGVRIMPSAKIWAPWNLCMGDHSGMGEHVDCYCVAKIEIGRHSLISQYCFLCTASHDHERPGLPGIDAPIRIGEQAWLCADVYVAPGITIGEGAVVGARSSVFRDVPPWLVVGGTPAKPIKPRTLRRPGAATTEVPRERSD